MTRLTMKFYDESHVKLANCVPVLKGDSAAALHFSLLLRGKGRKFKRCSKRVKALMKKEHLW